MLRIIRNVAEVETLKLPSRGVDTTVIINGVSVTQNIRVDPKSIPTDKPFIRTFSQVKEGSPDDLILLGVLKALAPLKPGDVIYGLRKDIEARFTKPQRNNYFRSVELSDKFYAKLERFPYEVLHPICINTSLRNKEIGKISSNTYRGVEVVTSLAGVYIGSLLYKDLAEAKLAIDHSLYIVGLINE